MNIHRPSKPAIFGLLMLASLVFIFLPPGLFRPADHATQLMATPFQRLTGEAASGVRDVTQRLTDKPVPADEYRALMQYKQALIHENAALRKQNAQLRQTIEALSGVRAHGFSVQGKLIPARVVARDAAPGRESLVINMGTAKGVQVHDWVISAMEIDTGTDQRAKDTYAVMTRQCLLGWVESAGAFSSRVTLLSDRFMARPRKVQVVAPDGSKGRQEPPAFVLEGAGNGKMRIRDIFKTWIENDTIQVGSLVTTSDTGEGGLPWTAVVGEIEALQVNRDKPGYYEAVVRYPYDLSEMKQVFVADLSPLSNPKAK